MRLLFLFTLVVLFSCNNGNNTNTDLIAKNVEVLEDENLFLRSRLDMLSAQGLKIPQDEILYLLDIEIPDSIASVEFDTYVLKYDEEFYKEEINELIELKRNYNGSLTQNDSLLSKNHLALFKNRLINFIFQSFDYCGPDPRLNHIQTFTEVLTREPQINKEVDVKLSIGLFDTNYVYKIYIGGYADSTGLNSSRVTDTITSDMGFGTYTFVPQESGYQTISGVMELKTKSGPKYYPFSTEIYVP